MTDIRNCYLPDIPPDAPKHTFVNYSPAVNQSVPQTTIPGTPATSGAAANSANYYVILAAVIVGVGVAAYYAYNRYKTKKQEED
jgi:hypothetical protein